MKDKEKKPLNKDQSPEGQPPEVPAEGGAPENPAGEQPEGDARPEAAAQVPMVAMTMEEYDALQHGLEQALIKAAENLDGWQRERADFLNYKKRIERDSAQVYQNALVTILKKYLVILDDLERALKACPTEGEGAVWAEGITLIHRKRMSQW